MISKCKSSHKYKKINYLFKTIHLSLELIIDSGCKKMYWLLKKTSKIKEKLKFSKHNLKKLSILISKDTIYKKKLVTKVSRFIFKTKETIQKTKIFNKIPKIIKPFIGSFFDLKQIIKC